MYQKIYVILLLALVGVVIEYKPIVANPLLFPENLEGKISEMRYNVPPIAQNDSFVYYVGCNESLTGNIIANDVDEDGDSLQIYFVVTPRPCKFSINSDGSFSMQVPEWFSGTIEFEYYITEKTSDEYKSNAKVIVEVIPDFDCDGISDVEDMDEDNDGIPDVDEGDGSIDSDWDGIPDSEDIDSDNDGITDNVEWQEENSYVMPMGIDANKNGWDDAYDNLVGGKYSFPVDTNVDGIPDYLDTDTDGDGICDLIEAFDLDNDGHSDMQPLYEDIDRDGLDDAFDNVEARKKSANPTGSNCVLIDFNKNGVRDWRDLSNRYYGIRCFVYPNPVVEGFRIIHPELKLGQTIDLKLFSIDGKLLFQKELIVSNNVIDVPELDNGVYRILVNSEGFISSQNIIIAR